MGHREKRILGKIIGGEIVRERVRERERERERENEREICDAFKDQNETTEKGIRFAALESSISSRSRLDPVLQISSLGIK